MDLVYKALADPTRRELLDRLRKKAGQTLSELCEGIETSRQSVTKHLNILERANLISVVWQGREKVHYLNPVPIRQISRRWVSKFSKPRTDALLDLKTSLEDKVTAKPEFNYVTYIAETPEKVWEALTTPEFTKQYWFGTSVESDWEEGSKVSYMVKDGEVEAVTGEILKADKPNELVYTFQLLIDESVKDEITTVQFLLEKAGETTRLTVRHYDFKEDSKMLADVSGGWTVIINGLKTLLESGKALKTSDG